MIEDYDNVDYDYFKEWDIEQYKKELERLNKELQDTKEHLGEYLHEQEEENKRLNNIIKEVREYIRSNEWGIDYEHSNCRTHLLEILDKVDKEK
jgi:flagellar biosynthesis/type III secretory pathway chaperone